MSYLNGKLKDFSTPAFFNNSRVCLKSDFVVLMTTFYEINVDNNFLAATYFVVFF